MNQDKTAPHSTTRKVARPRWDIFCHIVDNYGDIGVCWRLARQLAHEYGLSVRLWVDELGIAQRLITGIEPSLERQAIDDVEICHWAEPFADEMVADVVIEAFGCELPQNYLAAMAKTKPIWLNLEYLSAENWVAEFHLRPSPHPALQLTKYFFFPGFTEQTGGLLREQDLIEKRDAFQNSSQAQARSWKKLAVADSAALKVSLFCYADAPIVDLLESMAASSQPVLCLVPDSGILPTISEYFGAGPLKAGDSLNKGNLTVRLLPFLSQDDYDCLLWACDLNLVRGEDSWVRALWAAKPMIWQPYRQQQETHLVKLQAFLDFYSAGLSEDASNVLREAHASWCSHGFAAENWQAVLAHLPELKGHAIKQAKQLAAHTDLAAKLVIFCQNQV